jgi:pilus assembly protein CpaE
MNMINVSIISPSQEKTKYLKAALNNADGINIAGISDSGTKAVDKIILQAPDIVLFSPERPEEDISDIVRRLYISLPACSLILICGQADFSTLQQAVKAGVRNVLKWPLEAGELEDNIHYLYNVEALRLKNKPQENYTKWQSQVVTVFGTKGGIGKTTISVNLATALARMGKRVAILDLDLQFGDVGVFFDIDTKDSIAELVSENNFEIDKIKSYMQLHRSGVSVLCAPKSPEYAEAVTAEHVERIVASIRPHFDFVVIDTPPSFNDITITALEHSDLILFILTLDVSTLRNAKISMGILDSLQNREKTKIIVNREVENIISLKDAEKIIKSQVFGRIPSDWKTATMSLNKGVPFVIDMPGTKISAALYNLAKQTGSALK